MKIATVREINKMTTTLLGDLMIHLDKYKSFIERAERDLGRTLIFGERVDLLLDNFSEIPARGYALDIVLHIQEQARRRSRDEVPRG
jgi:hypothetical protein